jgi:hypothetical protein
VAYQDPQLLHLDSMLTGWSAGYGEGHADNYVAKILYPTIFVVKDSDKYYVHNRDVWGRVTDDIRTPGSEANELPPMTLSRDTYFIEEHALEDVVPVEEVENADDPLSPMQDATMRLNNTIWLNREQTMVNNATTAANYATGHTVTLSGTAQWSDYGATSDPVLDVKTGRDKIHSVLFRNPTVAIAGYQVAIKMEDHPDFIERIKYSQRGVTTDQIISEILGIPRFRRAEAGKLTSAYGAAETVGYLWPKDFLLAYVPARPGRKVPSFGYEFVKRYGRIEQPVERWFEIKRKSDVIRTSRRYDLKHITIDGTGKILGGYLIKNAVA